jgi:hypothetical protein
LPLGPVAACGQARRLAAAMGAVLAGCDVDQLDVVVTTTVRTSGRLGGVARASARAGPSSVDEWGGWLSEWGGLVTGVDQ